MRQHAGVFAANFSLNLLWQNCFAPKKSAFCAEPRRAAAGILDVCQGGATMGLRETRLLRRMFSYARRPKGTVLFCYAFSQSAVRVTGTVVRQSVSPSAVLAKKAEAGSIVEPVMGSQHQAYLQTPLAKRLFHQSMPDFDLHSSRCAHGNHSEDIRSDAYVVYPDSRSTSNSDCCKQG